MKEHAREKHNLHLILGGQRSGKTAFAENIAGQWLNRENHHAIYVATAQAYDPEIERRIKIHQKNRAEKWPKMQSVAVEKDLSEIFSEYRKPEILILIDCLGMWLTNWIAALEVENYENQRERLLEAWQQQRNKVLEAILNCPNPVILVSHEVGFGVVPPAALARDFVDELGALNQMLAARAARVSLLVAGLEHRLKGRG